MIHQTCPFLGANKGKGKRRHPNGPGQWNKAQEKRISIHPLPYPTNQSESSSSSPARASTVWEGERERQREWRVELTVTSVSVFVWIADVSTCNGGWGVESTRWSLPFFLFRWLAQASSHWIRYSLVLVIADLLLVPKIYTVVSGEGIVFICYHIWYLSYVLSILDPAM